MNPAINTCIRIGVILFSIFAADCQAKSAINSMQLLTGTEDSIYKGSPSPRQRDFRLNFISESLLLRLEQEHSVLIHVLSQPKEGIYTKKINSDHLAKILSEIMLELEYPLETEYPTVRIISWNHAVLVWASQLMDIKAKEFRLPNLILHKGQSQNEIVKPGDIIIFE